MNYLCLTSCCMIVADFVGKNKKKGFILTFQANLAVSLNVAHPLFLNGGRARTQS